jgi:hypothetical protein
VRTADRSEGAFQPRPGSRDVLKRRGRPGNALDVVRLRHAVSETRRAKARAAREVPTKTLVAAWAPRPPAEAVERGDPGRRGQVAVRRHPRGRAQLEPQLHGDAAGRRVESSRRRSSYRRPVELPGDRGLTPSSSLRYPRSVASIFGLGLRPDAHVHQERGVRHHAGLRRRAPRSASRCALGRVAKARAEEHATRQGQQRDDRSRLEPGVAAWPKCSSKRPALATPGRTVLDASRTNTRS